MQYYECRKELNVENRVGGLESREGNFKAQGKGGKEVELSFIEKMASTLWLNKRD